MTRADRVGAGDRPALEAVAHQWLRAVKAEGFVPGRVARTRARLSHFLQQLVTMLRAEPFDPTAGAQIGAALVEARMAAPGVLGVTVTLLADRLPALLDPDDPVLRARVTPLLGQLAYGFTAALREDVVETMEVLYRTERVVWREDQQRLQSQLQHARLHDAVTDLPNRVYLRERLQAALRHGARTGGRLGLCLLSIDSFGNLNDVLGHGAGDDLLSTVGLRLGALVADLPQDGPGTGRHPDAGPRYLLAHLGHEQFVLAVTGTTGPDEMIKLARLARDAVGLASSAAIDGYQPRLAASTGIVEGPVTVSDPDDWLRNAHLALSWTRAEHRSYAVYEPVRAAADLDRHRLAAAMPEALAGGEFEPYFQPLHVLADRSIFGVEALARWNKRGRREPLGPHEFIGPAEQTGLIRPLGQALLRQACHQGAAWRAAGHPLLISVNLSPLQLADPELPAAVSDILDATGLPAVALQLEITESAAVDGPLGVLHELTDRGIGLAIDDFGTGQANLAALGRLPVRTVKLPGELVAGLNDPGDAVAAAIVHRTIQLCHDLGIKVTAEGIETETQYAALRASGCDYGQGFLFAKPAAASAVTRLLATAAHPDER